MKNIQQRISNKGLFKNQFGFVIFFLVSVLYINTAFNDYNLDDYLVTQNHRLTSKGIEAIPEIFTSPYYQDKMGYSYEYRPIVLATFAIEHSLFGDNPHISHLINVFFYFLLCLLIFHTLTKLWKGISKIFVLCVVMLFAAHPIHTEAVASIKNRDEIIAMIAAIMSLHLLLNFFDKKKIIFFLVSMVFFFVAMITKKTIITSIIIIPILIILFRQTTLLPLLLFISCGFLISVPIIELSDWDTILIYIGLLNVLIIFFYVLKNYQAYSFNSVISNMQIQSKDEFFDFRLFPIFGNIHLVWISGIIITAVTILYYIGNFYFLCPALIFFIIPLFSKNESVRASIILFIASLMLFIFLFKNVNMFLIALPGLVFLIHWFSRSGQVKFIYGILTVAYIFSGVSFLVGHMPSGMIINATLIYIMYYIGTTRFKFIPLFIFSFIFVKGVISMLAEGFTYFLTDYVFTFEIFYFLSLSLYFISNKLSRYLIPFLFFIIPFIAIKDMNSVPENKIIEKLLVPILNANKNYVPSIIEKDIDRPLDFVESSSPLNATFFEKAGTGIVILGRYFKLLLIPYPMSFYYGYNEIKNYSFYDPISITILILHILSFILAIYLFNKNRIISGAILLYLFMITPYSNIIYPVPGMMGDRFLFVPSLGYVIIVVWILFRLFKIDIRSGDIYNLRILPEGFKLSFIALMLLYSGITISRNLDWKNELTLMQQDITHVEESAQAHNLLATNLMKYSFKKEYSVKADKMRGDAIKHYKKAVEIYPEFFNAWVNLGRSYLNLNDMDNAYDCFIKVYEMDSTYAEALINLATISSMKGNIQNAVNYYEKTIRYAPYEKKAYYDLSYIYFKAGMLEESININKKAIQYNPNWKEPYENIARVYYDMKDTVSANYYYSEAQKRQ